MAVICYDILSINYLILSDESTFKNVVKWLDYVREERGNEVLIALVANKIDST